MSVAIFGQAKLAATSARPRAGCRQLCLAENRDGHERCLRLGARGRAEAGLCYGKLKAENGDWKPEVAGNLPLRIFALETEGGNVTLNA